MVFISGYKMVKEALATQFDTFADRPVIPLFQKLFEGLGKQNSRMTKMHDIVQNDE